MTVARVSQAVIETLRTGTAVSARVSQAVIEVLRPNPGVQAQVSQAAIEVLRANGAEVPISSSTARQIVVAT